MRRAAGHRRSALAMIGISAVLALGVTTAAPSLALAGTWTQLVCSLNGQMVPIDGVVRGGQGPGATEYQCGPSSGVNAGLVAQEPSSVAVAPGSSSTWTYTAPPGSTIAGGSIALSLHAPGGFAYVATPAAVADAADELASCAASCGGSTGGTLTETVPIDHPGGTQIFEVAECLTSCNAGGGSGGLFAQANIYSMAVELATPATPTAGGFGGGLLIDSAVKGTQPVTFTASEPAGPGIYTVAVMVDGKAVYNAIPNANGGECAIMGVDPSGYREFQNAQPCATSVNVSVPVDTTQFADGTHDLSIAVQDAAGTTATVFDRSISISNNPAPPVITPPTPTPTPVVPTPKPAPTRANPCTSGKPLKPTLSLKVSALGHARLRFTGVFHSPHGCPLGTAKTRPLVIAEVENGRHWQTVGATARITPGGHYTATYGGGHQGSIGGTFSFRAVAPSTARFDRVVSRVERARVR
jgi:hypothetical protein